SASKYATAQLGRLDLATGALRLAGAGHLPALLVRDGGGVEQIESTGRPLGLLPDSTYGAHELTMAPGDLLALYTDGYAEAADAEGAEFGVERLADLLESLRTEPLPDLH